MLHTKYESSGPCCFGEEDFLYVFPIVSLWELMTPGAGQFLIPGAWLARFIKSKRTTTLLHAKYESSGPCGFGEDFFYVSTIVSLWELMTPGAGPFSDPRGIVGRIYCLRGPLHITTCKI